MDMSEGGFIWATNFFHDLEARLIDPVSIVNILFMFFKHWDPCSLFGNLKYLGRFIEDFAIYLSVKYDVREAGPWEYASVLYNSKEADTFSNDQSCT